MPVGVTRYGFTERMEGPCLLDVWVVSKHGICEDMKLCVVGRLNNGAEPFRLQRIVATCGCLLRHVTYGMRESIPTCVS